MCARPEGRLLPLAQYEYFCYATTEPLSPRQAHLYLWRAGHLGDLARRGQEPDGACATENQLFLRPLQV